MLIDTRYGTGSYPPGVTTMNTAPAGTGGAGCEELGQGCKRLPAGRSRCGMALSRDRDTHRVRQQDVVIGVVRPDLEGVQS
jgi:hypothetical protein